MKQNELIPTEPNTNITLRRPDWRWTASGLTDEQFIASGAADDEWAVRARTWRQSAHVRSRRREPEPESDSAFRAAYRLRHNGPRVTREVLEAALLTGESANRVAAVAGFLTTGTEVYSKVFFDVEARLGDRKWVETTVIGPTPSAKHAAWKRFAYYDGLAILELVVAVSLRRPLPAAALAEATTIAAARDLDHWLRDVYTRTIAVCSAPPERVPLLQRRLREWAAANPRPTQPQSPDGVRGEGAKAAILASLSPQDRRQAVRVVKTLKTLTRDAQPPPQGTESSRKEVTK